MVRQYSAKARGCVLTYKHNELSEGDSKAEWIFEKNETIHKQYRSYRDANCIDDEFVEKLTRDTDGVKIE